MNCWNLDKLYLSFEDQSYLSDFDSIQKIMNELSIITKEHTIEALRSYLGKWITLTCIIDKIAAYTNLKLAVNTSDEQALKYSESLDLLIAGYSKQKVKNEQWISSFSFGNIEDSFIQEHLYILNEIKEHQKYRLDEESESIIANMRNTGSSLLSKYKDQLISDLLVNIDEQEYPLTEVLNMAYSDQKDLRKKAYFSEIESYKSIEKGIATCLNGIKGEVLYTTHLRGYTSELEKTLIQSRMSKETLDVLMNVVKKNLQPLRDYLKIKAHYLGYAKGLPWYDLYAPIVKDTKEYSYDYGTQFVIKQFSTFSKHLGDFAKKAIEKKWIDVYPHSGKVGGAFCHNIHSIKESRFLLNYGEHFSDIITMAHELGHGFHGECLKNQTILNADYPMPIAETASTFCETLVTQAALKEADEMTRLQILENSLSDASQVILDIYSRFLFESRFFEKRKNGALSVEEIKNLMIEAQKEAYGDGLDDQYLHPYMWTWKPHYYDADYSFYNFPYVFGLLLSKGLFSLYQKDPVSFPGQYENFLSATGKNNLEDIALSIGLDLKDEAFWQASMDMVTQDVDVFKQLVK